MARFLDLFWKGETKMSEEMEDVKEWDQSRMTLGGSGKNAERIWHLQEERRPDLRSNRSAVWGYVIPISDGVERVVLQASSIQSLRITQAS